MLPDSPVEFDVAARGGRGEGAAGGGGGPDAVASEATAGAADTTLSRPSESHREIDIPWFDSIMEGSRLGGRLRTTRGTRQSADGTTRIEFEITEYTDDGGETKGSSSGNGKRKLGDRDDADQLEGATQS